MKRLTLFTLFFLSQGYADVDFQVTPTYPIDCSKISTHRERAVQKVHSIDIKEEGSQITLKIEMSHGRCNRQGYHKAEVYRPNIDAFIPGTTHLPWTRVGIQTVAKEVLMTSQEAHIYLTFDKHDLFRTSDHRNFDLAISLYNPVNSSSSSRFALKGKGYWELKLEQSSNEDGNEKMKIGLQRKKRQ